MKIVYAMCSPRQLDFYLTDKREAVPQGATVFAICTGERTIENQDEDLFAAISDEEYFTLQTMVKEAERLETKRRSSSMSATRRSLLKVFRNLFRLLSGTKKSADKRRGSRRFPTYRTGEVSPVRL